MVYSLGEDDVLLIHPMPQAIELLVIITPTAILLHTFLGDEIFVQDPHNQDPNLLILDTYNHIGKSSLYLYKIHNLRIYPNGYPNQSIASYFCTNAYSLPYGPFWSHTPILIVTMIIPAWWRY